MTSFGSNGAKQLTGPKMDGPGGVDVDVIRPWRACGDESRGREENTIPQRDSDRNNQTEIARRMRMVCCVLVQSSTALLAWCSCSRRRREEAADWPITSHDRSSGGPCLRFQKRIEYHFKITGWFFSHDGGAYLSGGLSFFFIYYISQMKNKLYINIYCSARCGLQICSRHFFI